MTIMLRRAATIMGKTQKVYATWNSADKGASIVLSNGDLTIRKSASNWQSVRSTISKASGKWYWEVKVDLSASVSGLFIGIGTSSMSVSNYTGADAYGWGYQGGAPGTPPALKYNAGSGVSYGINYVLNDVIGVALDVTGGTIEFFKNNVSQGVAYTGLSGTFFASASCYTLNTDGLTANFGATALAYTPPSGYNAGLYT